MKRGLLPVALAAVLAAPADARPVKIERNSPTLEFSYEWSAEAAAVPALDRRFRTDADKALREAQGNALEDQAFARRQKRDFNPHFFSRSWSTLGQSRRLLSLEGATGTFTGGAHPNSGAGSLLWDRVLKREVTLASLFLRPGSFSSLTRSTYCRKLDTERRKRRQGEKLGGDFDECPPFRDLAIMPADADRDGRFERIRLVASPYVAGPYAEGEYEIDVPVTRQLMAAMKPVYRGSFEPQRQ